MGRNWCGFSSRIAAGDSCGLIWFIWSVWSIRFNQTNEIDRTDQMNKTVWQTYSIPHEMYRESRAGDDCQNTVSKLLSVIFRRSCWLSKKMMPRSVPISYRSFTSVSNPVQLKNLTGPPAI